ncbi:MAG: ATP-binding protein [Spirochaetes bacterium]|nr:ATP-binding protein [Spirochaetota bacterium]
MGASSKTTLFLFDKEEILKREPISPQEELILEYINARVVKAKSLNDILDFLFEEINQIIPCDRLDIAFVEDDQKRMVLHYVKASYSPIYLLQGYATDIAGGSIQQVFQSGMPSVICDMEAHAKENPLSESARLLVQEGIRSSMATPLSVEGKPLAMLMCRSKKIAAYGPHEVRLQMAFAEQLAQSVEKAYRLDELSRAMNSYMEMLSFVSHELKSPLASLITLGKTLASGYFGKLDELPRQIVERIVKKAEYLHNMTEEYLTLANFETGEIHINPREVNFIEEIVEPSLALTHEHFEEQNITIEKDIADNIPPIICDPALIKIVLNNLLSNAAKYGNKGGTAKLKVQMSNDRLRVSVWNEGPGFPEHEKVRLFKRFSKIQTPELLERKGHGVGLYVSWNIIHMHGGRIWAASKHGKWAEFSFELPPKMDQCILH